MKTTIAINITIAVPPKIHTCGSRLVLPDAGVTYHFIGGAGNRAQCHILFRLDISVAHASAGFSLCAGVPLPAADLTDGLRPKHSCAFMLHPGAHAVRRTGRVIEDRPASTRSRTEVSLCSTIACFSRSFYARLPPSRPAPSLQQRRGRRQTSSWLPATDRWPRPISPQIGR